MSTSIKVILYTSKTLTNGEHPLMLRIIKNRKPKYIALGYSCTPELWDTAQNMPKKKHPHYKELLIVIDKKKLDANKLILDLDAGNKGYSSDHVQTRLKKTVTRKTLFQFFDDVIARLEKSNRIGYANIFKSTKNSIATFRDQKDMQFSDITASFIYAYEANFLSRGVAPNSIFVFLRTFKTLLSYARKEAVVREDFNPFQEISFTKYRRIKTAKRSISKAQIKKIADLKLEEGSSLFHARNYFLFSYYNRGMNFIDMAHLKWNAITGPKLTYERRKTKENFIIGMLPPARSILRYYKSKYAPAESDYVFPILSDTHITARSIDNRIDRVLKLVNKDLQIIGPLAGIKEKLTTYVARHSYATIMRRSGVAVSVISEALGHDSEKTTQIYLESFDNKLLDEASKAIL